MKIKLGKYLLMYAFSFIIILSFLSCDYASKNQSKQENEISTTKRLENDKASKGSQKESIATETKPPPEFNTKASMSNTKFYIFKNEGLSCSDYVVSDISVKDSAWHGLFDIGNGLFELKSINVGAKLHYNPDYDEEEIRIHLKDGFNSLYIMGGYNLLKNRKSKNIFFATINLNPSDKIPVPGTELFIITESLRMVRSIWADTEPGHDDVPLIEFKLIANYNNCNQILIEKACGTPTLWVGCLNNDVIPDIIFTAKTNEGLTKIISLFLSNMSTGNKPYKKIAEFRQHLGPL